MRNDVVAAVYEGSVVGNRTTYVLPDVRLSRACERLQAEVSHWRYNNQQTIFVFGILGRLAGQTYCSGRALSMAIQTSMQTTTKAVVEFG